MKLELFAFIMLLLLGACGQNKNHLQKGYPHTSPQIDQDLRPETKSVVNITCATGYDCTSSTFISEYGKTKGQTQDKVAFHIWKPKGSIDGIVYFVTGRSEYIEKYEILFNQLKTRFPRHVFAVYDHYGQGHSDGLSGHVDSFERYVYDLGQFVETVKGYVGASSATPQTMIAHSMGGAVATFYAANPSNNIHHFALMAPMIKVSSRGAGEVGPLYGLVSQIVKDHPTKRIPMPKHPRKREVHMGEIADPTYSWLAQVIGVHACLAPSDFLQTTGYPYEMACPEKARGIALGLKKSPLKFLVFQSNDDEIVDPKASKVLCDDIGKTNCEYINLSSMAPSTPVPHDFLMKTPKAVSDQILERLSSFIR